jgi:hypothetical protein
MKTFLSTGLAAVVVLTGANAAAQDRSIPSRAEVDRVMLEMVKQFNAQMAGTKVDEMTIIRMMTYDRATPSLGYLYSTNYIATTGQKELTQEYIQQVKRFNIEKTCSSPVRPLLRAYGLQVVHSFSDATSGKNILQVRVTASDCDQRK